MPLYLYRILNPIFFQCNALCQIFLKLAQRFWRRKWKYANILHQWQRRFIHRQQSYFYQKSSLEPSANRRTKNILSNYKWSWSPTGEREILWERHFYRKSTHLLQKWITVTIHLLHHMYKAKARMGQGQRKYATDKALTHTHWILDFDPFSRKLVQSHYTSSMLIGTLLVKLGFMFWKRRISNLDLESRKLVQGHWYSVYMV